MLYISRLQEECTPDTSGYDDPAAGLMLRYDALLHSLPSMSNFRQALPAYCAAHFEVISSSERLCVMVNLAAAQDPIAAPISVFATDASQLPVIVEPAMGDTSPSKIPSQDRAIPPSPVPNSRPHPSSSLRTKPKRHPPAIEV